METPPNIVWISLESIRYDHTSLSDYSRDTTPSLRQIAKKSRGDSFKYCITHGKWTGTSSASILTGTHPPTHGIYGGTNSILSEDIKTIPEILSGAGYRSIGISSNANAGVARGLDRGFDEFNWMNGNNKTSLFRSAGLMPLLKVIPNIRDHTGGISTDLQKHKSITSFLMTEIAKRSISNNPSSKPLFLYLHYNSTHHPYIPPKSYLDTFTDDLDGEEALEISRSKYQNIHRLIANIDELTDEEWDAITAMYDAAIRHVDACVGDLADYIFKNAEKDTILIITADHGELLGEYGLVGHKFVLDDALIHVPLIIHGLKGIEKHTGEIVQHIDIMKTVLSEAGIEDPQLEGNDLFEQSREFAVTQRSEQVAQKNLAAIREYNPDYVLPINHPRTLTSVRSSDFKLLHSDDKIELFKLPNEQENIKNNIEQKEELEKYAQEWLRQYGQNKMDSQHRELDQEIKDHLSDMGYIV